MKALKEEETTASDVDVYLFSELPSVATLKKRSGRSKCFNQGCRAIPVILTCLNARESV